MSQKRIRNRLPRLNLKGVMYFITTVTYKRRPIFAYDANSLLLRETMRVTQAYHPFVMKGWVIMPDHVHLLMQLKGQTDISKLMQSIKRNFTRNVKKRDGIEDKLTLWHHRFMDHVIRDERDYEAHLNYIHLNPVKHGYATKPEDYQHSSYLAWVERGWYEIGWGHIKQPYDDVAID